MNIVDKREGSVSFDDLNIGDVFEIKGNIYMKIVSVAKIEEHCSLNSQYNAVELKSGELKTFIPFAAIFVDKLDIDLVIK